MSIHVCPTCFQNSFFNVSSCPETVENSVFFEHILGLKLLTQYHFNHCKFSHHIYAADN